ncbi:hypothetical protein QR680_007910 [Steinernema hermaphroditum]|uniref:Uncharacterized protein n=1 Tax=Steinernema hermaphroditum TaxID=289476 RepID=A0AA39M752_9BILA|nr:hypothetical protein QR680_007910 [Steinernema hermaphroditum]
MGKTASLLKHQIRAGKVWPAWLAFSLTFPTTCIILATDIVYLTCLHDLKPVFKTALYFDTPVCVLGILFHFVLAVAIFLDKRWEGGRVVFILYTSYNCLMVFMSVPMAVLPILQSSTEGAVYTVMQTFLRIAPILSISITATYIKVHRQKCENYVRQINVNNAEI